MTTDVRVTVLNALTPVLSNTYLDELPPKPTFPAIIYDVESEQETTWCAGGGYDQHQVTVMLLAQDADWFLTAKPAVVQAFEGLGSAFMFEESSGDADYEDDPNVFAFFFIFRLRTPRY